MSKYILFGAGAIGVQALQFLGNNNVGFFIDNNVDKQRTILYGLEIKSLGDAKNLIGKRKIVISLSEQYYDEIIAQLKENNITDYCTYNSIKFEYTKKNIMRRIDFIDIYNRSIKWIYNNSIEGKGVICNSNLPKPYPEVSGYYIPTLIRWGHKDLAITYAKWLCSIQHENGAWYDTENQYPYIFDSAQILKGLIAVRDLLSEVDGCIIKGTDWILSNMTPEGRLVLPLKNAWGDGKTFSELIHTYCISPIMEAGKIFNRTDYIEKAHLIALYYTRNCKEEILNFKILSHFYAYVIEAMIDIGKVELAREAMEKIAGIQKENGAVPGYNNVDWVCSTGLFQLALVWFRLGDSEHGNKAFEYACKLQNQSGGWYGSYLSEINPNEDNTYFPNSEISWANKYFLDALYYKNIAQFDEQAHTFRESISTDDGRYKCIESIIEENRKLGLQIRVLDMGCGKGRYLRNLVKKFPDVRLYGSDLSPRALEYTKDKKVIMKCGNLTNIPFDDCSFDVTYTCEALEHAVDIKSAVKELCRVTKSGGTIAILDKNKDKLGYFEIEGWEQWFDKNELKKELLKYCSDVQVIKEIPFENHPANGLFYLWVGIKKVMY